MDHFKSRDDGKSEHPGEVKKPWKFNGLPALVILIVAGTILLAVFVIQRKENGTVHDPQVIKTSVNQDNTKSPFKYFADFRFDTAGIKDPVEREFVIYGRKLVDSTATLMGPLAANAAMHFAGNSLSCSNCHLNGGTRAFAAPYIGVWGTYPNFRKRSNSIGTLEDRINGCMERSLNGRKLPIDGKEMKAMLAYIKFINKDVPIGEKIEGTGFIEFTAPDRMADRQNGETVYVRECSACHGKDGQGQKLNDAGAYVYPPLWGNGSFNDGAGMHRLLTAAAFIKGNMPYGVAVNQPKLTDDEAYDVAAYINSFPRPVKANKEKDYPDLKLKPMDCPYPPYADTIPLRQHQLGPFTF